MEPMPDPVTLVYKTLHTSNTGSEGGLPGIPLCLDVYLPGFPSSGTSASGDDGVEIPVVVYFHGGGLVVGNRKSWFPGWLHSKRHVQFHQSRLRSPSKTDCCV